VDAYSEKPTTIVDRNWLTTFVTIDVPCRGEKNAENSAKFRVWDKILERRTIISEDTVI